MSQCLNVFPTIEHISTPYNGVLLDAYGVFRGGSHILLPGAREAMKELVSSGKVVGILTNATTIGSREMEKLASLGIFEKVHFHFLLTSGDVAKDIFLKDKLPFATPKKKYWLLGKEHPRFSSHGHLFSNSAFVETVNVLEADFIYISIPHINGEDQTDKEVFREEVKKAHAYGLPMVCTNPDHYAHEGSPARTVVRQGSIAKMHEELGGNVFYVGKPSKLAFSSAMRNFANFKIKSAREVLMVGDTPETDIRGAKESGLDTALLTKTGMFADKVSNFGLEKSLKALLPEDSPDYLVESLGRI